MAEPTSPLCELRAFRAELHACLTRRADALFELVDALLSVEHVSSLPHLSLAPIHRRGWGSVYAALAHGCVDVERLQALFAHLPLTDGEPIYAVDVTTWPRCDAETSPERGFYYHPSRHSAGQPIVAGWAFQWIAQLSFSRDSWTAPVDAVRLRPHDNHNQAAITQVRALIERLPVAGATPLFVFDAGYDPCQLGVGLDGFQAAILVRLRSGRCFYADPPPAPRSGKGGRPRRHGAKLDCADPITWPVPTAVHVEDDDQYGTVTVQAWAGLHPKQQLHPTRGTKRPRPIVRGTLIRVQVARIPAKTRPPQVSGCGGKVLAARTWPCFGAPMCAASTSSTQSASPSRRSAGPPPESAIPSRQTGGPGWCWPPTPNSVSPEPWSTTSGCPGSVTYGLDGSPLTESGEGLRHCYAY
jgi:hypothetical protein